jgi:hypothetical protein
MAKKILQFLSERDKALLKEIIRSEQNTFQSDPRDFKEDPPNKSPDVYFVTVPIGGIPARSGVTLGTADCDVYKIVRDGSSRKFEQVKNADGSNKKIKVYNPYKVKWYYSGSTNKRYVRLEREKYSGGWVCERPSYFLKAKTVENIAINTSELVNVWINGALSSPLEQVTAHLNWMHGGQLVSGGLEVMLQYFEDEDKWVIINAECEAA